MRIIGGRHRGRKLISPASNHVRPTSDRMRETIFNIISHGPVLLRDAKVLDVFAGTGALGLEALSRGATHATFIEKDPRSVKLIQDNIGVLKLEDSTSLKRMDALKLPPSSDQYDLIFLDPPYGKHMILPTLTGLKSNGYLAGSSLLVVECPADEEFETPDFLSRYKSNTYGQAKYSFLKYQS